MAGIGAILGSIVGSFLAALIIRWPQDRSVMTGRSACDQCGTTLGAGELIPLLSFLAQMGKCRHCGARINPDHLAVELAAAVIGGVAMAIAPGFAGLAGALFGWIVLALVALDVRHFWLPDRLTLPLLLTGIAGGIAGLSPPLADRLWGAAGGFASLWLIAFGYRMLRGREGLGGGDPKLLGAIGAWLGWQALPLVVLGGSGLGLCWLLIQRLRGRTVAATDRLPLGALLGLAAFPLWIWSQHSPF